MSDPTPAPATPPAPAPANPPPPAPAAPPAPEPGPVPYTRFQEVNQRLQEATQQLTELRGQQQQAKTLEQRLEALEGDLARERLNSTRLKVATDKKLPAELLPRLQGNTEAELVADADALLAIFGQRPTPPPGVPPSGSGGRGVPLDLSKMTPQQIRDARKEGKI